MADPENNCALLIVDRSKKELLIIERRPSVQLCHYLGPLQAAPHALQLARECSQQLWHLGLRFAEGLSAGIGVAASKHIYKRVGEGLVDAAWDRTREKLRGVDDPSPTLYGPDGNVVGKKAAR